MALHRHAAKLASDASVEEVVKDTFAAMKDALGFDHAEFAIIHGRTLRAEAHTQTGGRYPVLKLSGPGIVVKAANRRRTMLVPDVRKEPAYLEGWKGMRSELAVPVLRGRRAIAVLNVESARLKAFDKEDQQLLETLASHVSSSLGRLRLEESLRASETKMRGILAALPDLVFEMDSKGVYVNYYAWKRSDLAVPPERFLGKSVREVLPEAVADKIEGAMKAARKSRGVKTLEYRLPTLEGKVQDWEAHISRTAGGGFVAVVRNVTANRRAEERLRQSEARYRSLVDGMLDGSYRSTHGGRLVDVNPAFVKMFGYSSRKELLALPNISGVLYFSPEDRASVFLDTGQERVEVFRMRKKDGSEIWVEDHGRYIHDDDGKVIFHEGVLRDVTERVQAEEALRQSETRYRDLVELSPVAIAVHDGRKLQYVNPAAAKIMGIEDRDRVVGMDMANFIHPDSRPTVAARVREELSEGKQAPLQEEKFLRMDGSTVDVEAAGMPISWHGAPGVQVVFQDITQRKMMATELKRYSEHLEELVKERTEKLKEAERLAAMGQLAAMVAHDLRNPLTGITGATYYLRKKYGTTADEKTKEMLEIIEKDVEYSNKMMTSLVEYSGGVKLSLSESDPRSIVEQALTLVRIPDEVKISNLAEPRPKVTLDEEKLVRVAVNLIHNAVEAMPQGGELTVKSSESGNNLELTFSDTGHGMSDEALSKVWTPFSTTKAKGMGLGLPMAKQIIEAHGGTISVESAVGKGTTVTVTLPVNAKPKESGAA
jgi:PAS domain S-box-containing protein